ncbi:hypothetical protein QTL95_15525 [Rhizobium sp. S152]|uniref:COG4223 family protein n=1 Tax=Rhizobium sp. S152 TaxID=3055038 RepID=UPI0025A930FA|nr:hypothetical protein [Rhizobium sp. S152]MDM9627318.1 hypothetical protein [Rhizobium sp. S152]
MAPGNPPRHSKSTDKPVTIDLGEQEFASAREPEKPADQAVETAEETLAAEIDASRQSTPKPDITQPSDEPARESVTEPEDLPPPPAEPRSVADEPPLREPPQRPQGGQTSGLIAAGILGGLIALVGAGAMQYAGYLPGPTSSETSSPDVANLSAEIDGIKQSLTNLAAAPATDDGTLEKRLAALEAVAKAPPVSAAAPTDTAAVDQLNQKIADLSAQLDQLRGTVTQVEQSAPNGAAIEQRLSEAEKKLDEPRRDVAVAQAIAAAALKAAIDRGGPFTAELDTFAGVSPDDPAVADLRNFSETGVPSRAELIRQVPTVATAIVESVANKDPNQNWSDRLMNSAKSLVSVRPVGNIEGDSVEAIAARMEDKVKNGDLPGAANEWTMLPADAKQASAAFKQSLEARIRVEDLVGGALSKAISGAGKEN